MANLERLRGRWLALWRGLGTGEGPVNEIYADLAARYDENGRYYHNFNHIARVLRAADQLSQHARDFTAVQLALWFHDVVYDPRAADNEEKSAAYAAAALQRLQLRPDTIDEVLRLILMTKTHAAAAGDVDGYVVLDADLAALGAEWPQYLQDVNNIRQEYAFVPEPAYWQGRRRVLAGFLQRERIFQTELLFATLEARARQNIAREMASL